jgi:hypothetical protein
MTPWYTVIDQLYSKKKNSLSFNKKIIHKDYFDWFKKSNKFTVNSLRTLKIQIVVESKIFKCLKAFKQFLYLWITLKLINYLTSINKLN